MSNRNITQTNRLLSFEGNKAFDLLIPTHFIGTEGLSELFSFAISGYCKDINLRLETLLHSAVALNVNDGEQERYFHGYVSEVEDDSVTGHNQRQFRITLRPQLWFLSKVQVCAIHQNQSIPELVESVLSEYGIQNINLKGIKQSYQTNEYIVQYNESVLNLVLRLLEHAGIQYYFSYEKNKHSLHLLDNLNSLPSLSGIYDYTNVKQEGIHLHDWQSQSNLVSKSVSLNDYNYQDPTANLITTIKAYDAKGVEGMTNAEAASEIYEYANSDYQVFTQGQRQSNNRLNQAQNTQELNLASGNAMNFSGGHQFQFNNSEDPNQSGQYRLTQIQHQAHDHSHINLLETQSNDPPTQSYQNHFRCISSLKRYIPNRHYQKPKIQGHHHAIVAGPKGKAIYTDKQGRIKVTFPWNEHNDEQNPENNSRWIRVMQNQSGKGWGMSALPRVGHEVLIGYQEGDIDRPICLGSAYNEIQQPAYTLPETQHLSGIKTRTMGSSDSQKGHEIQFNDLPGKENLKIQAQNQLTETINHDAKHSIGNAFTETVQGNKITNIKGEGAFESPKNITLHAGGGKISIEPNKITIQGQHISMGELGGIAESSAVRSSIADGLATPANSAKKVEQMMYPKIDIDLNKIIKEEILERATYVIKTELSISGKFSLKNKKRVNSFSVSKKELKIEATKILSGYFQHISLNTNNLEEHEIFIGGDSLDKNYTVFLKAIKITPIVSEFENTIGINLTNKSDQDWKISGAANLTVKITFMRKPNHSSILTDMHKWIVEYWTHWKIQSLYLQTALRLAEKLQVGAFGSQLTFLESLSPEEDETVEVAMMFAK